MGLLICFELKLTVHVDGLRTQTIGYIPRQVLSLIFLKRKLGKRAGLIPSQGNVKVEEKKGEIAVSEFCSRNVEGFSVQVSVFSTYPPDTRHPTPEIPYLNIHMNQCCFSILEPRMT